MTFKLHYRPVTGYRELPAKARIIYPEDRDLSETQRYLGHVDKAITTHTHSGTDNGSPQNLVSWVFRNQTAQRAIRSYQLASILSERRELARRQLRDLKWRLNELQDRKPLRLKGPAFEDDFKLTDVEKQILDLEKQQRSLELELWRDSLDPRQRLVEERREYQATRSRIGYLTGGFDAGA